MSKKVKEVKDIRDRWYLIEVEGYKETLHGYYETEEAAVSDAKRFSKSYIFRTYLVTKVNSAYRKEQEDQGGITFV